MTTLSRTVAEAQPKDAGRGVVRVDPADLAALGLQIGDLVKVQGGRAATGRVLPAFPDQRAAGLVCLDDVLRENAQCAVGDSVELSRVPAVAAKSVVMAPVHKAPRRRDLPHIGRLLDGLPVSVGDAVQVLVFDKRPARFEVVSTEPAGTVVIAPDTELVVQRRVVEGRSRRQSGQAKPSRAGGFSAIGGLDAELRRIREMIELPLQQPEVFEQLGVAPPKGVLLHGPPGCGKTLIARTIAEQTQAAFFVISGPEVIRKHYGESEARLREVFAEAAKKAPSIVFLDEIDALAPRRETVQGDVEKRVVATLLTLLDGLERRAAVVVIGATNLPDLLDPALRRPGRFDREIPIPIPDVRGRRQILGVHTEAMPLADDVDLDQLAGLTHGYVGADLEALCREAAMGRLRAELDSEGGRVRVPAGGLRVTHEDFLGAWRQLAPATVREVVVEVPTTRWEDIGGLDDVRARLQEVVSWPLRFKALFERAQLRPPRGVLLHGPPGCGKTMIARAVAHEAGAHFMAVDGPELLSKYVGESERGIRKLFHRARQAAPCVVFFDELDGLARKRSGDDDPTGERVLTQLLAEMDGVEAMDGVLVLAATNRLDRIDPALLRPGRFDELIEIPRPDAAGAEAILLTHLTGRPLSTNIDVKAIVVELDGFSGARVAGVVRRAALSAVRRVVEADGDVDAVQITQDDLVAARNEEAQAAIAAGEPVF